MPVSIPKLQSLSPSGSESATFPLQKSRHRWFGFLSDLSPSNWRRVVVNEKIDSVTMPKWIAVCILGAFLAFAGQSWFARSADHDAMIRIETKLEDAQKALDKSQAENRAYQGDMQAWREVINGNLKKVEGMLTEAQIEKLDKYHSKANLKE